MKIIKWIWSRGIIIFAILIAIGGGYFISKELGIEITGLQFELGLYTLGAAAMFVYLIILSGMKGGCFYHKNDKPLPPFLERYINNIHFIETDVWRAIGLGVSLFMLSIERSLNYTTEWKEILAQLGISILFMSGIIMAASYHFQRGITAGLKDDDHLDSIVKSEVAINLWWIRFRKGKSFLYKTKIQFWKPRIFSNRRRKLAQWFGIIEIVAGTLLMLWFNKSC